MLTTAPDLETAERIAEALVAENLAACVNLLPMRSIYRWEGKVERVAEVQLIIKTADARFATVAARLRTLHTYQVPEVLMIRADAGADAYVAWIHAQTALTTPGRPSQPPPTV